MQSTLDLALESAKAAAASEIVSLRLKIGVMSGVVPESLQFAFEALREGTIAAGARLDVELVPVTCWCETCQAEFEAKELVYVCPRCSAMSRQLRHGLELELASLEVN